MKREQFLMVMILLLLLLNLGTLAFLFFGKPSGFHSAHGRSHRPDILLKEKLEWNDDQVKQFEKSRDRHRFVMDSLDNVLSHNFKNLMQPEVLSEKSPLSDSLKNVLAGVETERAANTLRHFAELRSICNDAQKKKFDDLIPQLFEMLQRKPPRPKQP